jgi:outer membrane lipoprotein-sorting protein
MRHFLMGVALAAVFLAGCGEDRSKAVVPLDQVPEPAMKAAKETLKDVKFEQAFKKADGTYEVRGKNAQGKVREVEVTADGVVKQIE